MNENISSMDESDICGKMMADFFIYGYHLLMKSVNEDNG